MSEYSIDKSELYNKSGSLWDQHINTSFKSDSTSKKDSTGLSNLLYDMLYKQHLQFPVGNSGKFEIAGPKGPNLSPMKKVGAKNPMTGKNEYKKDTPGYSLKYTWDF